MPIDYDRVCFVVMPFGPKPVAGKTVNFDPIYESVFKPAIGAATLPEGGQLEARRTDKDFFSGDIGQEMFQYLEHSRLVLADISSVNANVFYELGLRHRARESGTIIVRQTDDAIPFDINKIKAFPYEYEPEEQAEESRALITRVLTESLQENRLDSPFQIAMRAQRDPGKRGPEVEALLLEAENAVRNDDPATAIARYEVALDQAPDDAETRVKITLLLKDAGKWAEAVAHARRATELVPEYGDAHRELGIALNKWKDRPADQPDGIAALEEAIRLNPKDFDALASLGGLLRRKGDFDDALRMYERSTEVSNGHSYPLLNAIKLRARAEGKLEIDGKTKIQLKRALRGRRKQANPEQPYDAPWSFFDSAEIELYLGRPDAFVEILEQGIDTCTKGWQPQTFHDTLTMLKDAGIELPRLDEALEMLADAAEAL